MVAERAKAFAKKKEEDKKREEENKLKVYDYFFFAQPTDGLIEINDVLTQIKRNSLVKQLTGSWLYLRHVAHSCH